MQSQGRLGDAISHFKQALRINTDSAWAHNNLGTALAEHGLLDEAIDHFEQAFRLDPENAALAHSNLGTALSLKGRLNEAIDHLQKAMLLSSNLDQATDLNQAADTLARVRYGAARAVVSQNAENQQIGEEERAKLRRQALGWLQANVDLAHRLQNEGADVPWPLVELQMDGGLASVRDPAELAKLPAAERKEWQRLWAAVTTLAAANPALQGPARAARREWAQAASSYARILKHGSTDNGHFWFECAAVLLLSGDRPGYRAACAQLIERCGKPGGPRAFHVARACTLAERAVADAALPSRLAERELRASAGQFWSLTVQGALAYRTGRFQEAVPLFEQSLRADSKSGRAVVNWLWLALGNYRLGKPEDARRWLEKAQKWLDQYPDGMPDRAEQEFALDLHKWLEAHVLRREAEELIRPKAPPTQNGNEPKP